MKVTYLSHSGFLVELDKAYLLFDYYEGEIPSLDDTKTIYVFVSHKHMDHYNWQIWDLRKQYAKVRYILSKDVPFSENVRRRRGLEDEDLKNILRVHGNNEYEFGDLSIQTLKSTDEGVAFAVKVEEKYIYHAGDLNLWAWEGESNSYNEKMKKNYCMQIDKLHDVHFDIAFVPLDSRQEAYAYGGMDYFMEKVKVSHVFPMHMWGKYELILKYKDDRKNGMDVSVIHEISGKGKSFQI